MRSLRVATTISIVAISSLRAQETDLRAPMLSYTAPDSTALARRERIVIPWRVSARTQQFAPLVSAVIPGGGQVLLGNDRFIGYVAIEALSWWRFAKNIHEQSVQEAEFKALARRVARAPFTTQSPDLLPDADWAYYEKMRDYLESGSYSLSVGGPLVPDTNVTTYNGSRWQLALNTYSTREAALQEYMRTAVTPEYEWSWKSARLQYDRFKRTTDKRNDAYRAGISNLMVIGANHILSMIDAFSTIRLRSRVDANSGTEIGAVIRW